VQPDALGGRADVVQPARRHEPAAPGGAPVAGEAAAFAGRPDPGERHPAKPGGADVEPAVRVEAELEPTKDADVDRRAVGGEHRLIGMPEAIPVDHAGGSSTSKSTSIA
jgi:hypothetical protein